MLLGALLCNPENLFFKTLQQKMLLQILKQISELSLCELWKIFPELSWSSAQKICDSGVQSSFGKRRSSTL
jgi:hypothetical protein